MDFKVSVVVTTYNGEKYIEEQLKSIMNQSRKPDEVFIFDDRSKDNTCKIVKDFINNNKLTNWHLKINKENKGLQHNFVDGTKATTGDIIFFSDQDDIWLPEKIEEMINVFYQKDADAVYCLENTIDENGNKIRNIISFLNSLWVRIRIKKYQNISIEKRMRYSQSPGHALAFKRDLLPELEKLCYKFDVPYDLSVGVIAAVQKKYYVINRKLVNYRVHNSNISSPDISIKESSKLDRQIESRKLKFKELKSIKTNYNNMLSIKQTSELDKAIQLTEDSLNFLIEKNKMGLLKIVFNNNKYLNKMIIIRNIISLV